MSLVESSLRLSLVVAICNTNRGIGLKGQLPWRLPKDLKHFSRVTTFTKDPNKMNAVIMGKLTWLSIPQGLRPLPNRLNVLISTTLSKDNCEANPNANQDNIVVCKSFDEALEILETQYEHKIENVYAIGGTQVFKTALANHKSLLHRIYLTRVMDDVDCDVFLEPEDFLDGFRKLEEIPDKVNFDVDFNTNYTDQKSNLNYIFEIYEKSE